MSARAAGLAAALLLGLAAVVVAPRPAHAQTLKHNCTFCHDLHGGSASALTKLEVVEDLCWSCHDNAVLGDTQMLRDGVPVTVPQNGYEVHNGAKHIAFSRPPTGCWDCHNHERESDGLQGRNLVMIQAAMPTPVSGSRDVIFKSRGTDAGGATLYSFADGDEDNDGTYTGVCEACHTETSNHQNGLNLPDASNHAHERGRTCSDCHAHSAGFPVPPCATCHNAGGEGTTGPNSRRAIIPEMSRTSHHVGSAYEDDDCRVCHDMSAHKEGTVRLRNVDTGGVLALGADPATDEGTARDVTYFCLACHDDAGAGPAQPFSDGLAPPAVDSTLWEASSHANDSDVRTCYGGTGGFGCHSTAHGSQKRNLLSPPGSAATSTWLTEDQEGFCLNCHDADGPATSDLKTAFNRTINWVQQATGLNSNPNLNDRHDVQTDAQTRSGARIECTSCHNPHTATASLPFILDPDPGDGHVVGTNWYFTAYQTANDRLSEFCLDCHDGSWPSGVTDSLPGIVNIRTTWVNDGMGEADRSGTVGLMAGSGWTGNVVMRCSACHNPHPVIDSYQNTTNQFAINDTTRSPTGDPLDGWYARVGGSWQKTFDYNVSSNASGAAPQTDGGTYCNTCHDRTSMVGKDNCYDCHRHGDGGRW